MLSNDNLKRSQALFWTYTTISLATFFALIISSQ
jgi:hypothetical protein